MIAVMQLQAALKQMLKPACTETEAEANASFTAELPHQHTLSYIKAMKKPTLRTWITAAVFALLTFLLCFSGIFYSVDKIFTDPFTQTLDVPDYRIKIIAIDEHTMEEYGDIQTWTRNMYRSLNDILNSDPEAKPAVVGYDVMFISDTDPEIDRGFAESAAAAGNVVTACNLVYKDAVSYQDGKIEVDRANIETVEYPYPAMRDAAGYGYANTMQDRDGYIRYTSNEAQYNGEQIDSLAMAIYRKFAEHEGITPVSPKKNADGSFGIRWTGKSGDYEIISMADVLDGYIDPAVFADSIVLVGAYAPGMMDSYNVPVQKGAQMYGVEIHANILQSLMDGRTGVRVSSLGYSLAAALVVFLFSMLCLCVKLPIGAAALVVLTGAELYTGKLLFANGLIMDLTEIPLMMILVYIYNVFTGYLYERLHRKKVLSVFRKYVAPQVVDKLTKTGDFTVRLGGDKREIAVLFVDIRGFTPISESLEPEDVVGILNEYLDLTTRSILNNGGTLDKFIGDATMAIFNAPFDLDDYIYRAVCTARDIAAGSDELYEHMMARYGKAVAFGIGVNCGPAVVGNIGSEFRMDYTAIGDTVNTAARLESNAKKGQILISDTVYEHLKDRLEVTEIGTIPLKGKSREVCVYQVDKVL